MKTFDVIEAPLGRPGWRVVHGQFMDWRDISYHDTKEDADAERAMHEWREAEGDPVEFPALDQRSAQMRTLVPDQR